MLLRKGSKQEVMEDDTTITGNHGEVLGQDEENPEEDTGHTRRHRPNDTTATGGVEQDSAKLSYGQIVRNELEPDTFDHDNNDDTASGNSTQSLMDSQKLQSNANDGNGLDDR